MASPGELVRVLARVMGVHEATMITHDRNLVMADLRSRGGRGWSAAKVTARDAAHSIVAVIGSGHVKDSVSSVRRYSETRPDLQRSSPNAFAELGLEELTDLPQDHSFVDALEALILSAAGGSLTRRMHEAAKLHKARRTLGAPLIEVTAQTPATLGDIRIAGLRGAPTASVRYVAGDPLHKAAAVPLSEREIAAWSAGMMHLQQGADLQRSQRISARTILRAAELLREGKDTP